MQHFHCICDLEQGLWLIEQAYYRFCAILLRCGLLIMDLYNEFQAFVIPTMYIIAILRSELACKLTRKYEDPARWPHHTFHLETPK